MVCNFHLTSNHDGASYPEMMRFMKILSMNEHAKEPLVEESPTPNDAGVNFFEYESDEGSGEDVYNEVDNSNCAVFTRGQ